MLNHKLYALGGSFTLPLWLPRYDKPRTGATSSSLSAGAVWGDWLMSPPSSYHHLEFHITVLRNSTEPKYSVMLFTLCRNNAIIMYS